MFCEKIDGVPMPLRRTPPSLFLTTILFFRDMIRTIVQIVQSLIEAPYINTKEDREIPNQTNQQIKSHDEQSGMTQTRNEKTEQNRHRWRAGIAACVLT